jgi:hypothetical protein
VSPSLFFDSASLLLKIIPLHIATEVEGTFRVNGSNKRMRELQAVFETPPRVRGPPLHLFFLIPIAAHSSLALPPALSVLHIVWQVT